MTLQAANYDAITFDCYGTLIDWDTGVANAFGPKLVGQAKGAFVAKTVMAFAKAQKMHQGRRPVMDYRDILARALLDAGDQTGLKINETVAIDFSNSVGNWPAFPDTLDSLLRMKAAGYVLGVASNVDRASFEETHVRLGGLIDVAVTAEESGAYKPDLKMFDALFAALAKAGIKRDRILHVAQSQHHDVVPGNAIGLDVVWIDRRAHRPGAGVTIPDSGTPVARYESLEAFCNDFLPQTAEIA